MSQSSSHSGRTILQFCWVAVALAACAFMVHAAEPIEGRWSAQAGPPDNRTVIALDLQRDAQGELQAFFYNDLLNFYRVALPGLERKGEGRYAIPRFEVTIDLVGDRLRVSGLIDEPLELARAGRLPTPRPVPNAPQGPEPRWQVRLGGAIFAPVAVRDGNRLWSFTAGRAIHGEALATDDALFFVCDNGWLYKLERASGKELWRYDLGDSRVARVPPNPFVFDYDHFAPRPTLADGTLYVGAGDGGLHAVDAATGQRVWRTQAQGKARTTAAVRGPTVVFATLENHVLALDRASGRETWRYETTGAVTGSPVFAGEHFIVGDRGSRLNALVPGRAKPLWTQPYWGSWVESSAVVDDGMAYIGSGDLFLVSALDPQTGRNEWRTHVGGWVVQRPALTARHVYASVSGARRRAKHFLDQFGGLVALDRTSGAIAWRWPMPAWSGAFLHGFFAAPVVAGDTVVVGGVDGTLYAFPVAGGTRGQR